MKPNAWTEILHRSRWCRTGVVLTVLALLAGGLPAAANSVPARPNDPPSVSPWMTVAASGPVRARRVIDGDAVWRDVSRGDELLSETRVKTGRKGRATLTRSSSLLIVAPDSEVELPADGYSEMQTSVIQTSGTVLYKIDGRANPHFEVVTPYLVAGVKGTSFLVTVNERYTSVTVREGLVEIRDPVTGERFDLRPGETVIRHRDDAVMKLVHDRRSSRDARRETKKLDRMERDMRDRNTKDRIAKEMGREDRENPAVSLDADLFGSPGDVELVREDEISDEISKELLEEMIGEGVHRGSLKDPGDLLLGADDPDDGSSGPGPGSIDPPVELPPAGSK